MYKFLCTDGLGLTMRQNELIELALTFDFKGIEIDMADMVGRADSMGMQFATQFVNSADVDIATYRLPLDLRTTDDDFAAEMTKLDRVCELSQAIQARQCYLTLASTHPELTYHENFEKHRARIHEIADRLQAVGVKLGLQFVAVKGPENEMQFIHKPEELVALVAAINHDNVGLIVDTWNWQLAGATTETVTGLELGKVFEVRLADTPADATPENADRSQRMEPGTRDDSIAQGVLDWIRDSEQDNPVALTAHVHKSPGNAGELPFQRIGKCLDLMIAGTHGQEVPEMVEPGETSEEVADNAAADDAAETVSTS